MKRTVAGPPCHPVVGLGQAALDLLGTVDAYPPVDQKCELSSFLIQGGGPVATALVTLARLGVKTRMLGRVGDDYFGRSIRRSLEQEGVDCRGLLSASGQTSQFAFIAVEEGSARRNIFWNRGSAPHLGAEEVDLEAVRRARVLHLDGLQVEASLAAARAARAAGVVTVLDGGTLRDGTQELLPFIDHLVVSEKFARQLAKGPLETGLKTLLQWGAAAATVTCGDRGSTTLTAGGELIDQPAFAVNAVDTTGCGDVFHGGYIYGLLQDWSLKRVLRFAAACAALKATRPGGRTGIPTLDAVNAFLAERN